MDLLEACIRKDTEKVSGLIMNNDINSGIFNANGRKVFMLACEKGMEEVALEFVKIGHANPEQLDDYGCTILICEYKNIMTKVALELIKTGHTRSH